MVTGLEAVPVAAIANGTKETVKFGLELYAAPEDSRILECIATQIDLDITHAVDCLIAFGPYLETHKSMSIWVSEVIKKTRVLLAEYRENLVHPDIDGGVGVIDRGKFALSHHAKLLQIKEVLQFSHQSLMHATSTLYQVAAAGGHFLPPQTEA